MSVYEFCTDGLPLYAREPAELIESPRRGALGMDSKVGNPCLENLLLGTYCNRHIPVAAWKTIC